MIRNKIEKKNLDFTNELFVGIGDVSQKGKLFKRWNKLLDISSTLGTSVSEQGFILLKPSSIFFSFIILIYFPNDCYL